MEKISVFEKDRFILELYDKNRYCVVSSFNGINAECELIDKPMLVNKNMAFNFGDSTIYIDIFKSLTDAKNAIASFNYDMEE